MSKNKIAPRALCPAPGCAEVIRDDADLIQDARERPWHRRCANRALADYFRTPLDLEALAGERVEFPFEWRADEQAFTAPHDFLLRAIAFEDDLDVVAVFVGADNAFSVYDPGNPITSGDFSDRVLPVDMIARRGLSIMVQLRVNAPFCCRLIGERFDPKARPTVDARMAYGGVSAGGVAAGGEAKSTAFMQYPARFDRVASRDWEDWEVVRVEVGGGPGRAVEEVRRHPVGVRLTGRSTPLPIFAVEVGEPVHLVVRNLRADGPRREFVARVYGEASRR